MFTTERLRFRPSHRDDAPALLKAIAHEDIVRNLASAPWPYSIEHAQALAAAPFRADEPRFFIFSRTSDEHQLLGVIGLDRMPDGEVELGYWISKSFWNRGYGAEAGLFMIGLAREKLGLKRIVAGHFIDNPASGRVLEKIGFAASGAVTQRHSAGRGGSAPCRMFALHL